MVKYMLLPTNCLSMFDHFVGLTFKGLRSTRCATWKLTEKWMLQGGFRDSNYVTLKLPFFDPPTPTITLYHEWSQDLPYVTSRLTQIPHFIIYSLFLFFWGWKKTMICTHPWHMHPFFKQLNQIVRFK